MGQWSKRLGHMRQLYIISLIMLKEIDKTLTQRIMQWTATCIEDAAWLKMKFRSTVSWCQVISNQVLQPWMQSLLSFRHLKVTKSPSTGIPLALWNNPKPNLSPGKIHRVITKRSQCCSILFGITFTGISTWKISELMTMKRRSY